MCHWSRYSHIYIRKIQQQSDISKASERISWRDSNGLDWTTVKTNLLLPSMNISLWKCMLELKCVVHFFGFLIEIKNKSFIRWLTDYLDIFSRENQNIQAIDVCHQLNILRALFPRVYRHLYSYLDWPKSSSSTSILSWKSNTRKIVWYNIFIYIYIFDRNKKYFIFLLFSALKKNHTQAQTLAEKRERERKKKKRPKA